MLAPEMIADDLLQRPVWQAAELGQPIPASPHAVSVALPRWQDVVGYEEKQPAVIERLATGYPRFVVHPLVQALARKIGGDQPCLPFPSRRAAEQAAEFVRRNSQSSAEILSRNGWFAVATGPEGVTALRAFWQHTGLIVSSRQAEAHLEGRQQASSSVQVYSSLRTQLAGLYDCAPEDIFLAPTGMASMFAALQAVATRTPGAATAQLGFPYVDTLKLQ